MARRSIVMLLGPALLCACTHSHQARYVSRASPSAGDSSPAARVALPGHPSATVPALAGRLVVLDPSRNGGNASHPDQIHRAVAVGSGTTPCDTAGTQTSNGYPEYAFSLDVALRVAAILRADGAMVRLTRTDSRGVGPCVDQRAAVANRAGAAVSLSIHADNGPVTGRGFHVIEPGTGTQGTSLSSASHSLALDVIKAFAFQTHEMTSTYTASSGLASRTDLGELTLSTVPAIAIVCANMRNLADASLVSSPAWRQEAAQGIADGVARWLSQHP